MNNNIEFMIKRDGSKVPFDISKINCAIKKALIAANEVFDREDLIGASVYVKLLELSNLPNVEQCQDIVEKELMIFGLFNASKAYILYREEHNKLRKQIIPDELKKQTDEATSYFPNAYQYIIYLRTYSRWLEDKGRREMWPETIDRFINYMKEIVQDKLTPEEYDEIKCAILNMEVMPSMRILQFAGDQMKKNAVSGYNCSYVAPTKLYHFHDIMFNLMSGAGVGFSVENKYISLLPNIAEQIGECLPFYIIEDSQEGWCRAFIFGLEIWYGGKDINFDYSLIRPIGARLKTKGGRAPGAAPLKELLDFSRQLILNNQGKKLSSIDVHDLICKIGNIVVSGGTRRSSELSLSDLNDEVMRNAKVGAFWNTHPDRCIANNSAVYNKPPSDTELLNEWTALVNSGTGERGIFSRSNLFQQLPERRIKLIGELIKDLGTNPCITGDTRILTSDGELLVQDLINKRVDVVVNGEKHKMISNGFYLTGKKDIYSIKTKNGFYIKATKNHYFFTINDRYKDEVKIQLCSLDCGNLIILDNDETDIIEEINYIGLEEVYDVTVEGHQFIANGFRVGNCGEILLLPLQFCNLTTAVLRSTDNKESIIRKIRLASIIGTFQSMLTNFKHISPEWQKLAEWERLLGVSMTGQKDCPYLQENLDILDILKTVAVKTNIEYASKFGINASSAVTTVKPEGTSSQMLGTSSGLHARHAPFYIRRLRISATDPLALLLIDQGVPYFPENGQTIDNARTWVFEFPQKAPIGSICIKDLTALDQLNYWKELKTRYTEHNPSCTISVRKNEWITVLNWIKEHWDIIGGLSFLPYDDYVYKLAPNEEISEDEYEKRKLEMPKIDFSKLILYEKDDQTERREQWACVGGGCDL